MINKIDINPGVRKDLQHYLEQHNMTLSEALAQEASNNEVANILYAGFPAMLKMVYSKEKMQAFFWEKKELVGEYLTTRLQAPPASKPKKKKRK